MILFWRCKQTVWTMSKGVELFLECNHLRKKNFCQRMYLQESPTCGITDFEPSVEFKTELLNQPCQSHKGPWDFGQTHEDFKAMNVLASKFKLELNFDDGNGSSFSKLCTPSEVSYSHSQPQENEKVSSSLKWIEMLLNPKQLEWHHHLYKTLTQECVSSQELIRTFLHAPVGTGKTRIALSVALRMMFDGVATIPIFLYPNTTEAFVKQEASLFKTEQFDFDICVVNSGKKYKGENLNIIGKKLEEHTNTLFLISSGAFLTNFAKFKAFLLKRSPETVVIVDECHDWMGQHTVRYKCLNDWRPKFQIFSSGTMLPSDAQGIFNLFNAAQKVDLNIGKIVCAEAWSRILHVPRIDSLDPVLEKKFADVLRNIQQCVTTLLEGPAKEPAMRPTYSCTKNVDLYLVFLKMTDEMAEKHTFVIDGLQSSKHSHNTGATTFLSAVAVGESVLFQPTESNRKTKCVTSLEKFLRKNRTPGVLEEYKTNSPVSNYCNKHCTIIPALIEQMICTERRKVIIVSEYTERLHAVKKLLKTVGERWEGLRDTKALLLTGALTLNQRNEILKKFTQKDNKFKVLLMAKELAIGLNLQVASRMILLEPWWSSHATEQAIGRVARTGQQRDVVVYVLTYEGTVEEAKLWQCWQRKMFTRYLRHLEKDERKIRLPVEGNCELTPAPDARDGITSMCLPVNWKDLFPPERLSRSPRITEVPVAVFQYLDHDGSQVES